MSMGVYLPAALGLVGSMEACCCLVRACWTTSALAVSSWSWSDGTVVASFFFLAAAFFFSVSFAALALFSAFLMQ